MMSALERQLGECQYGDHVCQLYEDADEAIEAAITFIKLGLARGGRCAYITGELPEEKIKDALIAAGLDVSHEQKRGALVLMPAYPVRNARQFNANSLVSFLHQTVAHAVSRGFSGLWLVGDMTWAIALEIRQQRVLEYEALVNELFATSPIVGICQYNRTRFVPVTMRHALQTHPLILLRNLLVPNLYYEPSDLLLNQQRMAERVEWMFSQLERVQQWEKQHAQLIAEQAARIEAEKAQKRLQEFLGMVTHEMADPLTIIQGYAGVLSSKLGGDVGEAQRDAISGIEEAARRLRRLLDDLRDASRIGAGRFEVHPARVDLMSIVTRVAQDIQATTGRSCLIREAPLSIEGLWDGERISQLLTNIIANAFKYAPPDTEVVVDVRQAGDEVVIGVTDQGAGLTREQIALLFQPFTRLHQEQEVPGMGLGLYICKGIVEAHGGRIWVDSEPGKGSTFCVALPRQPR